jgi:hypothetical protein
VSNGGAATQMIPIVVPPGTAAIEPRLTFNYNSQAENGLLGVGWSVGGLPIITRCRKTIAQDTVGGGINYDANDRFCLDGARLMAISGTYGANGAEYRTEVDTFLKIVSHGQAGSGPAYFTVQTKNGETMEFGGSEDSRIQALGKQEARVWALSKISDVKGNYFTVSYFKDVTGTNPTGEYHPLQIDYTKNDGGVLSSATRHVTFEYDQTRTDPILQYVGGSKILTTYRLTNVRTYQGGPDVQSSTLVRNYALTYESGSATGRSRVSTITEYDKNGNAMPPWQLEWQDGGSSGAYTFLEDLGRAIGFNNDNVWIADFNGDGRMDILNRSTQFLNLWFSQGDGTFSQVGFYVPGNGLDNAKTWIGDVNGDGIADLVTFSNGVLQTCIFRGADPYQQYIGDYPSSWFSAPRGPAILTATVGWTS